MSQGTQKETAGLVAQILKETGRIDALVNNAGIIRRAPAVDFSEADWNEVLRVNLIRAIFSLSGRRPNGGSPAAAKNLPPARG